MNKARTFPTSMKVAGLLAILVLITTIALSGTLAKYTNTATAVAGARVAAFDTGIRDTNKDGTINLYDTLHEVDAKTKETHVKARFDDMKIIAPGTGGTCPISVFNKSEVDVEYKIVMKLGTRSSTKIPIELRYVKSVDRHGNQDWSDWMSLNPRGSGPAPTMTITGELKAGDTFETKDIQWRWPFTASGSGAAQRDKDDTALGESVLDSGGRLSSNAPKLFVDYNVTFTQVD